MPKAGAFKKLCVFAKVFIFWIYVAAFGTGDWRRWACKKLRWPFSGQILDYWCGRIFWEFTATIERRIFFLREARHEVDSLNMAEPQPVEVWCQICLNPFHFTSLDHAIEFPSDTQGWSAYLNRDQWDDWGKYCTQFYLTIVDQDGEQHGIGQVKVGQRGLKPHRGGVEILPGHWEPNVPSSFDQLDDEFFSVGQDDDYYENLSALGP